MSVEISYAFPGDEKLQFRIASVRLGAFMKEPFKDGRADVIDWFEDAVRDHWGREGGGSPKGKWKRWARSTAKYKKASDRLMIVTGATREALTDTGGHGALRKVSDKKAELGINFSRFKGSYPVYHQTGVKRNNLPMRRVVDMGPDDARAVGKVVQGLMVRAARAAGFIDGSRLAGVSRAF